MGTRQNLKSNLKPGARVQRCTDDLSILHLEREIAAAGWDLVVDGVVAEQARFVMAAVPTATSHGTPSTTWRNRSETRGTTMTEAGKQLDDRMTLDHPNGNWHSPCQFKALRLVREFRRARPSPEAV